jgi:FkbM family methyltransferase
MMRHLLRLLGHSGIPGALSLLSRSGVFQKIDDFEFRIEWRGHQYRGNTRFIVDRYIFYVGAYSQHEIETLLKCIELAKEARGHALMLDIGANIGQHSLAVCKSTDRIIAFEPNPDVAARFAINIADNQINNIELHQCALGDADAVVRLGSGIPGNDGSRSLNWTLEDDLGTDVPMRHAERLLADILPPIGPIGVIKLDVEGHEKVVLSALGPRLRRDRPFIMFELVGKQTKGGFTSLTEVKDMLYANHALFGLNPRKAPYLEPFVWRRHEMALCVPEELVSRLGLWGA